MCLRKSLLEALEADNVPPFERERLITELLQYRPALAESRLISDDPNLYQGASETALSTPFYDYYQVLMEIRQNL